MNMSRRMAMVGAAVLLSGGSLFAQRDDSGEREVVPQITANDKEDIWTLHFRFQDPRIIVERVPGRGTRIVWYMIYRVYNLDPKKDTHTFVPDFELVTLDRHTRHADEVLPSVEGTIRKREDPTGRFNIKNSVTISESPIPLSQPDAFPRAVTGVAIWTDVDPMSGGKDKAPKTNKFSIFIAGLSNGYTEETNMATGERVLKRKTLQLDFERLGDGERTEPSGIRWAGNSTWMYRATTPIPELKKQPAKVVGSALPGTTLPGMTPPLRADLLPPITVRTESLPIVPVKREK